MKVYVVIGGWQYEGSDPESIQVFTDLTEAEAYADTLTDDNAEFRYDFTTIEERSLEMRV